MWQLLGGDTPLGAHGETLTADEAEDAKRLDDVYRDLELQARRAGGLQAHT